jgi:hypothetical protein
MNLPQNLRKVAEALLLTAGLYGLIGFCYVAFLKMNYPYMTNLGEPPMAQAILSFAAGKIPYHDLRFPPYSLVPYGPVYLVLAALVHLVFHAPFVGGRIVTTFASLGTLLAIYLILRSKSAGKVVSAAAALLFICHPYAERWGSQVNVDMTGVFFAAFAFYFLLRYDQGGHLSKRDLGLGIACAATAFFTKSSMLAVSASFFLMLLFKRKFKPAFIFLGILAALVGTIYLLLNVWTGGNYFFHTTYEISKRNFYPRFIYDNWLSAFKESPLFVAATLAVLWGLVLRIKKGISYLSCYTVLAVLLTVSMGKQGSDTNYLLEWCFLSAVALGVLFHRGFASRENKYPALREWVKLLVVILAICQCVVWIRPYTNLQNMKSSYQERKLFYDDVSVLIRRTSGKILSEDMGLLVANGREIFYEPFPMGQMVYSGVWDPAPILKELDNRGFGLAILYFYAPMLLGNRTFPPAILKMFRDRYVFVGRAELPGQSGPNRVAFFLYRPKTDAELLKTQ